MFEQFLRSYIEAIFFTNPELKEGTLSKEAQQKICADCRNFWGTYHDAIDSNPQQAGHDFWLTRNRHGAGFWDGDWPVAQGEMLTKASHGFGEVDLYVGDDGYIY